MLGDTAALAKAGVCPDDADQRRPAAITHAPVFLQRQKRPPRPPVQARSSSSWTPDGLLAKDRGRDGVDCAPWSRHAFQDMPAVLPELPGHAERRPKGWDGGYRGLVRRCGGRGSRTKPPPSNRQGTSFSWAMLVLSLINI